METKYTYQYKEKRKVTSISLSPDLYEKLNRFAKAERRSMSNVIEILLSEVFEQSND
jgi:hypothetical protein